MAISEPVLDYRDPDWVAERLGLEKNRKSQQTLMATIRQREGEFASQIKSKQQEIDEIDRAIDRII